VKLPLVKVLVTPRDKTDPYQESLHAELRRLGVELAYLDGPSRSQTLNLLLRPAQLVLYHLQGYTCIHIHWVHDWTPPWVKRWELARSIAELWFTIFLFSAKVLGFRLIWTAHNVMPHERVFRDDRRARRRLAQAADAVIVHAEATIPEIADLSQTSVSVIEQGSHFSAYPAGLGRQAARSDLGLPLAGRIVLHYGWLRWYKGTDRLIATVAQHQPDLRLVVVGECPDPHLRDSLARAAAACDRVDLRLGFVTDSELSNYFSAADAAVFPFRTVTNSTSVLLALDAGLPVLVPSFDVFATLPDGATMRFDTSEEGLADALLALVSKPASELESMAAAARASRDRRSWVRAAHSTLALYLGVPNDPTLPATHPDVPDAEPVM
jgi:glycosyltransferase involved in cell wall biosynthesis